MDLIRTPSFCSYKMSWQLFCSHRAAARIHVMSVWRSGSAAGAGGNAASTLGAAAQLLPRQVAGAESAGQLL